MNAELKKIIGQRDIEIEWLKKNLTLSCREKSALIEKDHPGISLARQDELLGMSRSSAYYQPVIDPEDLRIMNAIDEI